MKTRLRDISIHYEQFGSANNPTVVFLHGFPFSSKMWEAQVRQLPESFSAVTIDIRGHGQSDTGDGQYTIDLFVDDLIGVIDQLALSTVILCGLSMGGYIALRAIERHPERICGLILCDTKSGGDTNEEKIKRSESIKLIKTAGVPVFSESFVQAVFWEKSFIHYPAIIEEIRKIIQANSPLGICGTLIALAARTDTTRSLAAIHVPTLILVGEYDLRTPPAAAKEMQNALPHSELHVIPRAAHMSNLENKEDFNRALNTFLLTHWSTKPA